MRARTAPKDKERQQRACSPGLELDTELAIKVREGDRAALARLVDRHLATLYKYLEWRTGPGHEGMIAEVIRDTFAEALRKLRPYAQGRAEVPMRLWLLKLANRQLRRRLPRLKQQVYQPGKAAGQDEALRGALLTLPPRHQAAIALALFEELPPEEIAPTLGVTPTRAMGLLRDALRRLSRSMGLAD